MSEGSRSAGVAVEGLWRCCCGRRRTLYSLFLGPGARGHRSSAHPGHQLDRGGRADLWEGSHKRETCTARGREGAEQPLFSLCVTSVQLDALGLVVKSFGDDSGKCMFPLSFLLTDRQF